MYGTGWFDGCNLKFRISIYIIHIITIGVIIYYVFLGIDAPSIQAVILKDALPMEFQGKVDSVYYDEMNHNTKTVILSDGYKYGLYREWELIINLGDSLKKTKGSFKVEVFKKSGRTEILDYRTLVKGYK